MPRLLLLLRRSGGRRFRQHGRHGGDCRAGRRPGRGLSLGWAIPQEEELGAGQPAVAERVGLHSRCRPSLPWRNEWVFILDADERITPELAAELTALAGGGAAGGGYYVNRRFWFVD